MSKSDLRLTSGIKDSTDQQNREIKQLKQEIMKSEAIREALEEVIKKIKRV